MRTIILFFRFIAHYYMFKSHWSVSSSSSIRYSASWIHRLMDSCCCSYTFNGLLWAILVYDMQQWQVCALANLISKFSNRFVNLSFLIMYILSSHKQHQIQCISNNVSVIGGNIYIFRDEEMLRCKWRTSGMGFRVYLLYFLLFYFNSKPIYNSI